VNGEVWDVFLCDAKPVIVTKVDPVYPPDSIRNHEQGIAEFMVGRSENRRVLMWIEPSDSPARWSLQTAARAALDRWTWKPYVSHGQVSKNWTTRVYFKFEITPDGPRVQTFLREPPKKSR
jgi:hypothetical protein